MYEFRYYKRKRRQRIPLPLIALLLVSAIILGLCLGKCRGGEVSEVSSVIDTSGFCSKNTKNSADLVKWAEQAYKNGWGYVWGTYGCVLDESRLNAKLEQYPEAVGSYSGFIRENYLGGRTTDCVGLIKGYAWYDAYSSEFVYCSNGMPDLSADGMFDAAVEKGTIDTMPETAGLAVWKDGHIGVYIGKGNVIEARGTHEGVIKSKLNETAWTHWLRVPYIEYND